MAGQIPLEPDSRLLEYFDVLMAIGNQPEEIKTAMVHTRENLQRTSRQVGRLLAMRSSFSMSGMKTTGENIIFNNRHLFFKR